ncbi:MAG TPA: FAD/NAD(P)-binding oxidoreductase [Blastocatellia bacterium]|nr:FAD/NAD(P)-binding oxidoreductase [Blastocatellia bacterium]HMV81505.1 FAD/NAD(P)-binding oxidoreductase [Blastocatellia bacterium]HMX25327.1 FAD/NAD(P)-binding oxidoreductase [Blastocatellia bacterium]HMY70919.1 FAD/NAD(P)-binding oxidoreductase [Blastocatellia bacterium]HNG28564.1 FAD/NAD(P)-binding oxidoreductase [Blastocatellia bacterium]
MNSLNHNYDVLVIGGGPAGLAAAATAAESGARVAIVDDNPGLGGQIWRGEHKKTSLPEAANWLHRVQAAQVEFIPGARVYDQPEAGVLLAESFDGVLKLGYRKLILATGARERFLPFPGWTLPGVAGAGGLQALVKSGLPIENKKVVIAGTGPLLLAVAAYLRKRGAQVLLIAEQTSQMKLLSFGLGLWRSPGKVFQALQLKRELAGIQHLTDCWPVAANGNGQLQSVTLRRGRKTWEVACDYLACGFHLLPNTELAVFFGCALRDGVVQVNEFQETTMPGIYCAGESTGIGGLDVSLIEGRIAGLAAADQHEKARALFAERRKHQRFADSLNQAFAMREELKELPQADTIVCRCEDVNFARLKNLHQQGANWRTAKLHTRCGMGPCQGRICGGAIEFLLGWPAESVRPPVFPVKVGSLIKVIQKQ